MRNITAEIGLMEAELDVLTGIRNTDVKETQMNVRHGSDVGNQSQDQMLNDKDY